MLTSLAAALLLTQSTELTSFGGGQLGNFSGPCLSTEERAHAESVVTAFQETRGTITPQARAKYQVFPVGGVLGDDLFPNNYVDLDATTGLRDWDCSAYTYDGHQGIDIDIKGFDEQEVGVPIFAALDGTVVETDDGNSDHNVTGDGQLGNHVILYHGGTHYSLYWHMKRESVIVKSGDVVKAGQQIGEVASSGNSTGPHLHFESWANNGSQFYFEPHTGNCNPGESGWVNQLPVPRQFWARDFNLSAGDFSKYPGIPWELPRTGTFLTGVRPIGFYSQFHNLPQGSTWRVRFLRPNGTVAYDSGTASFNNAFFRWSWYYWTYNLSINMVGTWKAELSVNGSVVVSAPFRASSSLTFNRNLPPNAVTLSFVNPSETGAPLSVKVTGPTLLDDPDYDVVRYRYVWKQNHQVIRDVVSAGHLDMIPGNAYLPQKDLTVTVTPSDGLTNGPATVIHTRLSTAVPKK